VEKRSLDEIAERLRHAKWALLLGAGCSRSAGIRTASEFVDLIKEQYPTAWDGAPTKDYQACMARLGPSHRRRLIQEEVKGRPLNLANIALASLIKAGKIDRVVTTNFDSLLIRACGLLGVEAAVYDVDALSSTHFHVLDIDMPAIFYVHGQYYGFSQHNAPDDYTPDHARMLRDLIRDISQTHTWLVVGYSGDNDPSAAALIGQDRFDSELYWVGYLDYPPCEDVQQKLLLPAKYAFYVPGFDADGFFVSLARKLGCDPMQSFRNPFSHLRSLFQQVTLPKDSEEENEKANSVFRVHQAIQQYEGRAAAVPDWHLEERLLVPDPHRGLLFTLPTFRQIRSEGYATPDQLVAGVNDADFRLRAFETNWGPAIVAVEHHRSKLKHCWISCTPQVPQSNYDLVQQVIASIASAVECHLVKLNDPNSILEIQQTIKKVYAVELSAADLAPSDVIADITGGLSTITGGIVLATLDHDRPIEYLAQGVRLVQDGRALTAEEIRDRQLLVAIHTTGEMVRDVLLRAS
jgi:hypothetical protein